MGRATAHICTSICATRRGRSSSLLDSTLVLTLTLSRLVAKPGGHSRHVPASRTHRLDPALDPTKFTTGKSKQAGPPPSFSRPLVGRSKRLKVQRRPIPAPRSAQNYEVRLADPGLWLKSVKNNTDQSNASALLPTSQIEKPSEPTENPKPTAAPKPTETPKPTAAPKPTEIPKPTRTPKPVPKLENPFVGSNLPQPQINSSTPRAQPRASKDADLLLNFDSPTKKEDPEPDMMELADDGDKTDSDTAAASLLERKLYWLRELGVINDILADFSISDSKQVRQLEERQKKVQGMIHAASKKVSKAPIAGGLQASRWADTDMDMATPREMPPRTFESKKPTNASDENRDYWQKALPKLPPLPANFMRTFKSPAPPSTTPQKPTKSIYESRYAC